MAISVAKLSRFSSGVSISWAAAKSPSTTEIGVFGWTTRPSGTASRRSPEKSSVPTQSQNASSNSRSPRRVRCDRRASTSTGRARTDVIHSANGPSPAATQ